MSPAAGLQAPLLPSSKMEKRPSVSGAVFNVATSIIGAGIMSIPATFKVLGVIPAFVLIVIIACLTDISVDILMRYTHAGETSTYAGVMRESFGRAGSVAVQLCVMITNLGCLIIFLIIIARRISSFGCVTRMVRLSLVEYASLRSAIRYGVCDASISLVQACGSAISVLLAVIFVAICSVMAIYAVWEGKSKTPKLLPQLDNHVSFFDLFTAVPVIVTAFTFHFNVHPIGFEFDKPSDMITAVRISLALCAAIYFSVGLFGYLLFGESIMSDILINFDQSSGSAISSLLNDLVRLSYALHLMLVFPMLNFSLRANIDELLFSQKPLLAKDTKRFLSITLVLLVFSYTAAITIPDIWYFFQFLGSTSAVCLAFIFPGVIVLRDVHGISTTRDRIIATVMIVLAVVTSTIAISTNIYSSIRNKS
ncbi:Amino acid transporter AVT6C [Citrus sinensis]|uniref:Amino acid transporter AVT6C n=1 Tax=Citrus sinensis TaxID=2711 RepID=A0ACB8L1V1_CITSI|nr:Amino acid transporter AVT6C [Citrus sinensis]